MTEKRPALGRGLSALIGEPLESVAPNSGSAFEVDITRLSPNKYQPREHPADAALEELASSIRQSGIIQPIIVRRDGANYQIVAGERRWRAARLAGLAMVPVSVRDIPEGDDEKALELALVENLQRQDLNPIEEAKGYRRFAEVFKRTQEQIAAAVGKDRSTIANSLRLLKLPADIQDEVSAGRISMGHARALLALETEQAQRNLARDIVARSLSVRETEQAVTKALAKAGPAAKPAGRVLDVNTRAAQEQLRMALGTKVEIVRRGKGGLIRIAFKNEDELQRLYEILTER